MDHMMTEGPARRPYQTRAWRLSAAFAAMVLLAALGGIFAVVPAKDGVRDWFAPLIPGGWMAWTFPIALFYWVIASLLTTFTFLAIGFPETPRRGVLGIETTRGDRLFITLLGSAFVCLAWLFFAGPPLWGGLALCALLAVAVFAFV